MPEKPEEIVPAPDFQKFATEFDQYLPLISPVGEAVLKKLPVLPPGSQVLDIACGTGEPGLTLARKISTIDVIGIDASAKMIEIANQKCKDENLENSKFKIMRCENLEFPDRSIDAVISRFGIGMFGDTILSTREIARILKPGGCFSIAVWHDSYANTMIRTITEVLQSILNDVVSQDASNQRSSSTVPGSEMLGLGFSVVNTDFLSWNYHFDSQAGVKLFIEGPGRALFEKQFALLENQSKTELAISTMLINLELYRKDGGSYEIPHACRLWYGRA